MKYLGACLLGFLSVLLVNADTGNAKWTLDLKKMVAPSTPAAGMVMGAAFKLDKTRLDTTGALILQQGTGVIPDAAIIIFLPDKSTRAVAGKSYVISADKLDGQMKLPVHVKRKPPGGDLPRGTAFVDGYAMRLVFGTEKGGVVPAKIYICLPDEAKSFITGSFSLGAN